MSMLGSQLGSLANTLYSSHQRQGKTMNYNDLAFQGYSQIIKIAKGG